MKLKNLYKRAIEIGIEADPRGKKHIDKMLKKYEERGKKLEGMEKELFDHERTWNPYSDCRIINGTGEEEVKVVMVGIDMEAQEVLLADRLREKGTKIDAIMTHHPEGRALADLDKVMPVQVDVYAQAGVPVNHAEGLLRPRMDRIWRAIHADNLFRTERTAELLGFPMFGIHTVTDNLVWRFMEKNVCAKQGNFDSLKDIMNILFEIEEFKYYAKKGNPPIIVNGNENSRPGKVVATEFTGGTNGPEDFIEKQSHAGVGTILAMHFTEKEVEEGKKHHLNLIQCSHMASDACGVNLLFDKLMKEDKKLEVLPVSGFIRVARK
jgi:putative NIF3 family GTP cyclohydrolase 1 type 2